MKNIISALIKAQKKIKHAQKDAKNPHFKNHYATLESVIDATKDSLLENEIVVSQVVTKENVLVTTLLHSSGEQMTSEMNLLNATNMQQMGSALTYARRYSLAALLNIAQTDDDGNDSGAGGDQVGAVPNKPQQSPTNPLDYKIKFGKFKDKALRDVPPKDLKSMVDWLRNESNAKKKPLTGTALELVTVYEHLQDELSNQEPQFDKDEKIPF